ncbi:ABC transporter permease [Nocardia sp. NPDC019395]|uniref:ABC transporter permease n=1 Tax=Nocardia sp. NPDC019395 TaxID=3154686 RepID=UPI0033FC97B0
MTTTVPRSLPVAHRVLGGFRVAFLRMELIRMLRNRRTLLITLVMPPLFFALFGLQSDYRTQPFGSGNVTGYVMVSLAVYGAMVATTSGGAMVAIERAQGWSRQLRLTPLRPVAYIATKVAVAMVLGLASVTVVFAVGAICGARLTPSAWVFCFLLAWVCSLVFAAFGLFLGYLLPSENVMQILGPALAALSFGGGLFIPLHGWLGTLSAFFPTHGVATLVRMPFGDTSDTSIALAVVNVAIWTAVFVGGAAMMFRRDTAR